MTDNVQPDTGPDDDALALAHTLFQAAREGDTALLRAYLDAGAPANLTNAAGDSLLMNGTPRLFPAGKGLCPSHRRDRDSGRR